jgi:hypothetical protein
MDLAIDETALFANFGVYVKHINWEVLSEQFPDCVWLRYFGE